MSLHHSSLERLTCLVDLIDLTLAFENANSKLVEVVTVADVDVVQVWKLKFGHKVNFLFRL